MTAMASYFCGLPYPSWPGLTRPSTCFRPGRRSRSRVDARIKSGHDGAGYRTTRKGAKPFRLRSWLFPLLALLLAATPPALAAEPQRTDPRHLVPPPDDDPHFEQYRLTLSPKKPQVVFKDRKKEWRKAGKVDKGLTKACRTGRFREFEPLLFRAIYSDDMLGVAFGHGLNLVDLDHKAGVGTIYLFRQGGTAACEVLTTGNLDPNAVPADQRKK